MYDNNYDDFFNMFTSYFFTKFSFHYFEDYLNDETDLRVRYSIFGGFFFFGNV
jgi:hypothetical protein